jgi:CBS domain-containing protein
MTTIEKIASPAPTLDSRTNIFDAIGYLLVNDCEHAFVQHKGEMTGIVAADQLLENYMIRDMPGTTIQEYMEPIFMIEQGGEQVRAAEIMLEHDVGFIAVTNPNGVFVGIAAFKNLGNWSLAQQKFSQVKESI